MNPKVTKALDVAGFLTVPIATVFAAALLFYGYVGPWLGPLVAHALFAVYLFIMAAIVLDRAHKDDWSLSEEST